MKSIIQDTKRCIICESNYGIEEHHIFFGSANRKKSEKYGLKVYLCPTHHRDNKNGAHGNLQVDMVLKRMGQRAFEKDHTREEFMKEFGKNYLD